MPSMTLPDYDFYKTEDQQRCRQRASQEEEAVLLGGGLPVHCVEPFTEDW